MSRLLAKFSNIINSFQLNQKIVLLDWGGDFFCNVNITEIISVRKSVKILAFFVLLSFKLYELSRFMLVVISEKIMFARVSCRQ